MCVAGVQAGGFTPVYRAPMLFAGGALHTPFVQLFCVANAGGVPAGAVHTNPGVAQRALAAAWNAPSMMLYA